MRTVSVRVLPVPGPATITNGASVQRTAARCSVVEAVAKSGAWCVVGVGADSAGVAAAKTWRRRSEPVQPQ